MKERMEEFFRRVDAVAREMNLEVEFTTETAGYGFMAYQSPIIEFVATDTYEYAERGGNRTFGERLASQATPQEPKQS